MKTIALIAAVVLPLWNIPLIVKIHKRRSAEDFSRSWALGVWICLIAMLPAALRSDDVVFKTYSIVNFVLFSLVVGWVLRFKRKMHH
ncbi:MAG: hypothetical protein ACE14U_07635 [Candidatus Velamenicoccus archaeovorus]